MTTDYKPLTDDFHRLIEKMVSGNKYINLQYFTDFHEFTTAKVVAKGIETKDDMEYLSTSHGDLIRLDQIVRIDKITSPNYAHFDNFGCDC